MKISRLASKGAPRGRASINEPNFKHDVPNFRKGNLFFMGTRSRKSADGFSRVVIDTQQQRLKPPDFLTAKEREIFTSIVDNCDPKTFRRAELPLLVAYVQALSLSRWYAHLVNEAGDTKDAFARWNP
jgi:hypothetical protein